MSQWDIDNESSDTECMIDSSDSDSDSSDSSYGIKPGFVRDRIRRIEKGMRLHKKKHPYVCPACQRNYPDELMLNEHYYSVHHPRSRSGSGDGDVAESLGEGIFYDVIESVDGEFICYVCEKKYNSEYFLGEHFMANHDNYDDLGTLDNNKLTGFPGFDLLQLINMICYPHDYNNPPKHATECSICTQPYGDSTMVLPVELTCCQTVLCKECLEKSLNATNALKCLFCKHDHSRDDVDFIYVVETDGVNLDKTRWTTWRKKHSK